MTENIIHNNETYKILYKNFEITNRIKELSILLNKYYKDNNDLILLGILDGCLMFLKDLKKFLKINFTLEYLNISSYDGKKRGKISYAYKKKISFKNKDILIVDDIIDSGNTNLFIKKIINEDKPKSIKTLSLLVKKESKHLSEWYGFEIKNKYVIGYGMDINNLFRDLNDIYIQEN